VNHTMRRVDGWLLGAVGALTLLGALLVWSATAHQDAANSYLSRQLINALIGVVLLVSVALIEHRWVRLLAPFAYLASVAGLVAVLVVGSTINGSRSWFVIAGMSVQPAEFAKLAVVVASALWVAERAGGRWRPHGWVDLAGLLVIAGVPVVLILLQPDLGTVLVLIATVFGVLAVAGVRQLWLVGLAGAGVLTAVAAVALGVLRDYQVDRFLAFTDPGLDPRGAGYNTEQARIAIGNGGLFGQGLFDGSQTRSGFVPEQQTDFVFTVAGEELGLLGAGLIIVLLGVVIWRTLRIAIEADDPFGRIAAAGIACWFCFQAFQNIGMCLGIMPVTGVPLPFVSYGGSSLFACYLAVGLLLNIRLRHKTADSSLHELRSPSRPPADPSLV
jgi:rod shape determining protein RodA